ncbi:histidine tRNA 5'-guanylyltransferase [Scenedesmus sp. NREL 46B-D3]|nr:histidine tRNA 5'-guanylyltransferase [Scenedesmus sp. NREL 46B-D3]
MANIKFEYVKGFEQATDWVLLPSTYIVIRVDGKGFTKFSEAHGFEKPNDKRALDLVNECAKAVMRDFPVVLAYGESDEYSFVLNKDATLYEARQQALEQTRAGPSTAAQADYRCRASKIISTITSCFTGNYVRLWSQFLPDTPLGWPPVFDGRAVCFPTLTVLKDYLAWRQADTHINNQYNTCYWCLVKAGKPPAEAQAIIKSSDTAFKNELLFTQFGINYAQLPEQFRKGSTVLGRPVRSVVKYREDGTPVERDRVQEVLLHCDIIGDAFWQQHQQLLGLTD